MLYCVSVGYTRSVAVDEVNSFVFFGHDSGDITRVTLDGSSTKVIFSTGKLNLPDCSRVVMGYDIILHAILLPDSLVQPHSAVVVREHGPKCNLPVVLPAWRAVREQLR